MKKFIAAILMAGTILSVNSIPFTDNSINRVYAVDYIGIGEVTADELNVRSGPGKNYTAIDSISRGHIVNVTEIRGDWCKITYVDAGEGRSGWVAKRYIGSVC
ncbi:SH3 domain-containing protein [Tepidibacter mesophilus]|uniref:SH3 domain-containing protein n=1 Tax=Tepidibacter mesophilus TaxID=655607 RepID=UPI001650F451|nr:SH3 domain-containing protein [Tepidibacter mesophilus]